MQLPTRRHAPPGPARDARPAARSVLRGALFLAVLAATAYPPALALAREGLLGAFRYLASDAFYYLSVANTSAGLPFYSFDGQHPTNGFHPLWQLYLERVFSLFQLDASHQLLVAAVTGIACVALGTALFALVLAGLTRRPWLAVIAAVPGLFYLVSSDLNPNHFAQWSFANGMESPLSILAFGALLYGLFERRWLARHAPRGSLLLLSTVLAMLVMSRLDDVFLLVPLAAAVALSSGSSREALRRVAQLLAVPALTMAAYLGYNALYAETLLPSSGSAKAEPLWALARNLYATWTTLLPFADPFGRGAGAWSGEAWRVVQMLAPAAAALAWLLGQRMTLPGRGSRPERDAGLVGVLAVYVLLKAGYNFAMVGLWHQGQWYYPLSIMTFNLIAAAWLARALDRYAALRRREDAPVESTPWSRLRERWPVAGRLSGAMPALAAACFVLISANAFVDMKQSGRYQTRNFDFWLAREETRRLIQETCPGCGVLSFDDGIVAYALHDTPTLNGLGLVTDREAFSASREGRLLDVAWRRGHRLLASVNYALPRDAYRDAATLREHLRASSHFRNEPLDAWDFEVAFESPGTGVAFVRFQPRDAGLASAPDPGEPRRPEAVAVGDETPSPARRGAPALPITPAGLDAAARGGLPSTPISRPPAAFEG